MRKMIAFLSLLLILLCLSAYSFADNKQTVLVNTIELSENETVITKGRSIKLKATVLPSDATVKKLKWYSSDEKIAIVQNGSVQAKSCGICDIICEATDDSGIKAICRVSVVQPVQSIQTKNSKITIPLNASFTPDITIKPEDATDKTVIWSSSDKNICIVDDSGSFISKNAGDCTITGTTADGSNRSISIKVHVSIFEELETDLVITNTGETIVPLHLNGFPLEKISHDSTSDKYFLYYIDNRGIHISPIANGNAVITVTNSTNKSDVFKLLVTIAESAVDSSEPHAVIVLNKPFTKPGDKVKAKYYVSGFSQPFSLCKWTWNTLTTNGTGEGQPAKINNYPSGSVSFSVPGHGANILYAELQLCDKDGKTAKVVSNKIPIDSLEISLTEDLFVMRRNAPLSANYKIIGGSGSYKVETVWKVENAETNVIADVAKNKYTSNSIGSTEYTFSWGDAALFDFVATDSKNKLLTARLDMYSYSGIILTDDWELKIQYDKEVAKQGEPIRAHIITNDKNKLKGCEFHWGGYKYDGSRSSDQLGKVIIEEGEYYVELIPSLDYDVVFLLGQWGSIYKQGRRFRVLE